MYNIGDECKSGFRLTPNGIIGKRAGNKMPAQIKGVKKENTPNFVAYRVSF